MPGKGQRTTKKKVCCNPLELKDAIHSKNLRPLSKDLIEKLATKNIFGIALGCSVCGKCKGKICNKKFTVPLGKVQVATETDDSKSTSDESMEMETDTFLPVSSTKLSKMFLQL